jgi:hypothetical protein
VISAVKHSFDPDTNHALARFERSFEYPLSEHQSFTICHGQDYLHFFRELGEVTCFVAKRGEDVQGVLTTVLRTIRIPGCEPSPVIYVCDLKISPESRGEGLFFKLILEAKRFYQASQLGLYCVVMNGTERSPEKYTGAWGIPRLAKMSEVAILRIPVENRSDASCRISSLESVCESFLRFSADDISLSRQVEKTGSRYRPTGLVLPEACGILEDTLACKRLVSQGCELVSAHLSHFAYSSLEDGVALVSSALNLCLERKIPALFVSVPLVEQGQWIAPNAFPDATLTSASIYGLGLPPGHQWRINTSEV